MLIDFTVENFRSYRDAKTFSLMASSAKELPDNLIGLTDKERLLRTAAIYGANASGKSNLLAAMYTLSELLRSPMAGPAEAQSQLLLPFGLDQTAATKPTRFHVRFLMEGIPYEYELSARPGQVENEFLVARPSGHRQEWFHRTSSEVNFNDTYLKGPKAPVKELTLGAASVPLLAVAKAFDHPQLSPVSDWLVSNFANREDAWEQRGRYRASHQLRSSPSARLFHGNKDFRAWANEVLRHADLGIQAVEIKVLEQKVMRPVSRPAASGAGRTSALEETTVQFHEPLFVHTAEGNSTVAFGEDAESAGTRRLFGILAPLYEVFQTGQLAVIDEFGTSMHPYLAREVVRLFLNPKINPKGAQLIFATHDTAMLSGRFLRRDQVWFTEKDHTGATDLYSLHEIKGVRASESLQKGYLGGRYGAIPFFGSLEIASETEDEASAGSAEPPPAGSSRAVS